MVRGGGREVEEECKVGGGEVEEKMQVGRRKGRRERG